MSAAISVNELSKRFGERPAVTDVSFEVGRGEVFGFLGPNGAGKTTTVRMLTGLLRPSGGEAEVAGVRVGSEMGPELRSRLGVMPEAPGLYLKLTVEDNLRFFAGLYGLADPDRRITAALDAVGLGARRRDPAGSLSKGLRQRTALARALLPEPEVLFLDEPTAGLDPEASVQVRELIEGLRSRGMTVFLTTHRLEEAERLCDRVAVIKTRLLTVAPTDHLRRGERPTVEVDLASALEGPGEVFEGVVARWSPVEGDARGPVGARYTAEVDDPGRDVPELVRALVHAGADVLGVREVTRSLEDAYLELVQEEEG